jgi:uncharacterized protein
VSKLRLIFHGAIAILAVAFITLKPMPPAWAKDQAQTAAKTAQASAAQKIKAGHKVAIQINDNDPRVMNLALNNAKNIADYYKGKGETVQIEVVAYGPGLHMLRSDSSPVTNRIVQMSMEIPQLSFAACENTRINMAKQEGKEIPILAEARVVPSGVVRLLELQESGFAYIRP